MNPKLWHNNIKEFQEYIKIAIIISELLPGYGIKIDYEKDAITQLKEMKLEVIKKIMVEKGKNNINEYNMNEMIDDKFNKIIEGFKRIREFKFEKGKSRINYGIGKHSGSLRRLIFGKIAKKNYKK